MKDPKVTELVVELAKTVAKLNELDAQLAAEGVYFTLERSSATKQFKVAYLKQTIEYNEELGFEP